MHTIVLLMFEEWLISILHFLKNFVSEQYTEIHHKIDVSTKMNLNITDTANQKEVYA